MFSSNTSQVSSDATYIEDVFSTYLYTGNGSTQTINNGIDLAGKGGLVWTKKRNSATQGDHLLVDTVRGTSPALISNSTAAQANYGAFSSFNSNGYTLNSDPYVNGSSGTYVGWTFRKAPKFFDIVTYTGNGSNPRNISHALGSTPGCIIVKETNASSNWAVWHRSLGDGARIFLNLTNASTTAFGVDWFGTSNSTITSTEFSVGSNLNTSGRTYVAYVFAHNAGGFGLTGTDNVISCGSFTADGSGNATINLGYEPQWVMVKRTDSTSNWYMVDSMRGNPTLISGTSNEQILRANTSDAETSSWGFANPTSTGFVAASIGASSTWIYIAIRRGPMKTPTSGTSVFAPVAQAAGGFVTTNFAVDSVISTGRTNPSAVGGIAWLDRLRGSSIYSVTSSTAAETNAGSVLYGWNYSNVGYQDYAYAGTGASGIYWSLQRAPGFFDEVCYTGANSTAPQSHNLGVAPELMIVKKRSSTVSNTLWAVYSAALGNTKVIVLNSNAAAYDDTLWNNTSPTATGFTLGANLLEVNYTGATYVAYLFASCPGVSKVGSYTGTGTTKQINCGFTGGARFVLIKRTDSTGDWYVWDSARGIVAGNDPYLLLNSTAAEVTSTDYVDSYSAGFEISSTAPAAINANGGSFIYLAIA